MNLSARAQSYADMVGAAETALKPARWWAPNDAVLAVSKALATERTIRARHRATVRIVHREPWLIGSVDAQQTAVAWARIRHTESAERTRALLAGAVQRQRAA